MVDKGGQASAGLELTPEMIEAGIDAYSRLDREFDSTERIVTDVFLAMVEAARLPRCVVSSDRQRAPISPWWQT
jgi:hypothetical protein